MIFLSGYHRVLVLIIFGVTFAGCESETTFPKPSFVMAPQVSETPAVPLARAVAVSTDIPSSIELSALAGNGHEVRVLFPNVATDHDLTLLGLRAEHTYDLAVTAISTHGVPETTTLLGAIVTAPLPIEFPLITVLGNAPEQMEPGYTLLDSRRKDRTYAAVIIVDAEGRVVWYWEPLGQSETQRLADGSFLTLDSQSGLVQKIDMRGNTLGAWHAGLSHEGIPGSLPVDANTFHHDVIQTPHGTFITSERDATQSVDNFPLDETDESITGTAVILDEPVIEFDETGAVIGRWPFLPMIKPTRVGFDGSRGLPESADWVHLNAIWYTEEDDSIIASLRHQDAIVKFSRRSGELKWILGPHNNWEGFENYLLTPTGPDFRWPYHTHAPMVTSKGTVLVFDNSNHQASPFSGEVQLPAADNFSRAVEYVVDEETMSVSQVWEYGFEQSNEKLYTPFIGDADELIETGNVLITFGGLCEIDGIPSNNPGQCKSWSRIIEVTHDTDENVFDLEIVDADPTSLGFIVYRSERLPTLYPDEAVELTIVD
jgi:arylsulfate sulfotransferase